MKAVTPRGMTLWGDNQHMLEQGVSEDQIIGYAAKVYRDDKEPNSQSLAYRMYLWLWQFWGLCRVVLPVVYRIRRIKY